MNQHSAISLGWLFAAALLLTLAYAPAHAENRFIALHSGKCMDVGGWSTANGGNVHQWSCSGGNNQKWQLEETSDGFNRLRNLHSGKCLDVAGWSTANGGNIHQWDCNGNANQDWELQYAGDGYYRLRSRHSGKCVDVSGPSTNDGANIHQWDCHSGNNQRFNIRNSGNYTETKYPIVLVHGIAGFNKLGGIFNYFFTIPYQLERSHAKVHVASVSAFNSSEQRGEELLQQIYRWGHPRVNLIGHSQGSPTARYAAAKRPDLVASVTSVNGVNKGSRVADVIRGIVRPGSSFEGSTADLVNNVGKLVNFFTGTWHDQNSLAALISLSSNDMTTFNNRYPRGMNLSSYCAGGGEHGAWSATPWNSWHYVRYYSWTGEERNINWLDPLDPLLAFTSKVFDIQDDGMVDKCSSAFGEVIYDAYDMDHADAVNQLFGVNSWTDPVSLYRQHANRLQNAGL